jgi:Fe(3+) dicitrate transport protein
MRLCGINKTSVEFSYKIFSSNFQCSYNSKSYNDAFNTISSVNGVTGIIPTWYVWDWNCDLEFAKQYRVPAGINNFTEEKYFKRRITINPDPGI